MGGVLVGTGTVVIVIGTRGPPHPCGLVADT